MTIEEHIPEVSEGLARDEEEKYKELLIVKTQRRKHVREGVGNPLKCCGKAE